jgi:hypothetical protein
VALRAGEDDERIRRAELTPTGVAEADEMDRRADQAASLILEPHTAAQRERLVDAMDEVHRLLRAAGVRIERANPGVSSRRAAENPATSSRGRRDHEAGRRSR